MHQQVHTGAAQAVPTLDARAWLAAWADHGGIAMLAGDRLYVSRLPGLDRAPHSASTISGAGYSAPALGTPWRAY